MFVMMLHAYCSNFLTVRSSKVATNTLSHVNGRQNALWRRRCSCTLSSLPMIPTHRLISHPYLARVDGVLTSLKASWHHWWRRVSRVLSCSVYPCHARRWFSQLFLDHAGVSFFTRGWRIWLWLRHTHYADEVKYRVSPDHMLPELLYERLYTELNW